MDWLRFRNTHLYVPWLFPLVIGNRQFDAVLDGRPRTLRDQIQRALERLLWFWPRVIDARVWATGSPDKPQTPLNYTTLDANGRLLLDWVERVCPDRDALILDLGCNCGRHLIYLAERGYRNLTGVDAMRNALAHFAERAPEVFGLADVHHDLFQRFLARQPDRRFDLSYSHGATIELVHPSFDIVKHLCRVTRSHICLIVVETERYRRDWLRQFARHGFALKTLRPLGPDRDGSLVVLRRTGAN
jgi:SAM-dependent methyltransferase